MLSEFDCYYFCYWTNEEYYECVVNIKNNINDNDDEKKEEIDESHLYSVIPDKNNKKEDNFLDNFVGDDSSDEDIDIDL